MDWTDDDQRTLTVAVDLLEHPHLIARLADVVGGPIERGFALLPKDWRGRVASASTTALSKALAVAVKSLGNQQRASSSSALWHRVAATASGATGGLFGVAALTVELPLSTTIMLRSIAAIARGQGEDLESLATRLQCLQVFAFGGAKPSVDGSESGYWAIRIALSRLTSEAATYIAERGIVEEGAPPLVRFIAAIATRFGILVSEEIAAKAIPIVGAIGGGTINYLFIDHFQKIARGHFSLRRLERTYGREAVRDQYEEVAHRR